MLNEKKVDKDWGIKFGLGYDNWIVNLYSYSNPSRKFWCTLTSEEKKALEEKYGQLADAFNTYL